MFLKITIVEITKNQSSKTKKKNVSLHWKQKYVFGANKNKFQRNIFNFHLAHKKDIF